MGGDQTFVTGGRYDVGEGGQSHDEEEHGDEKGERFGVTSWVLGCNHGQLEVVEVAVLPCARGEQIWGAHSCAHAYA